jgi:hypothetical protein
LDLRFAENKSLTDAKTGASLITFTRASTSTYVGSDGLVKTATTDEARFDHNPTTGESLGLLVEEARTNLLLRSEEFDNASWNSAAGARTVTANNQIAPDGTTTADTITADGISAAHLVSQSATLSAVPYAYSVFAKAGTNNFLQLRGFSPFGGMFANFNLATGVVGTVGVTLGATPTSLIQAYPNGWYRCTMVFTPTATTSSVAAYIVDSASAAGGATNSLSTSIYLWGAQLEAGSFPTSYIPTTSATVTRAADVASITGSNFSSWYNQTEGTVFVNAINPAASTTLCTASDGTANNRIQADSGTNTRIARVVTGGTTQANNTIAYTFGAQQQFALSYVLNSINFANAGTLGTEDTSATIPTVDQLRIGANPTGANALNNTIKRLTYWPVRLANPTLQSITAP